MTKLKWRQQRQRSVQSNHKQPPRHQHSLCLQNLKTTQKKTPDHGQIAEIAQQFPDVHSSRVHHYMFCMEKHCNDISKEEHNRIKVERNREKFHHSWLGNKAMSFCQQTAIFWPVYIEEEGFYCLLCKRHQTSNSQHKDVKFTVEPCVRIKEQSLKSHLECSAHQRAVLGELLNRVSYFQHQLDRAAEVEDEVYFNAYYVIYWLAKHCIANKQVNSLIMLLEHLGCEVKAF